MRALVLHDAGTPPRLKTIDEPDAAAGQQVVEVIAAALNPVDLQQASSSDPSELPKVMGNEAIINSDIGLAYAERTTPSSGSVAERTVIDPDKLVVLPEGVSPSAAVALGIPGIAAWLALTHVGQLSPNETVVVLGATGIAGQIAVQVAKILEAGRVVAAGRRREALEPLTDLGADVIAVLDGDDDTATLREAAGGDIDLVFDPLFGAPLVSAIHALRPGGRSVTIGMSAGPTAEVPFSGFLGKQLLSHGNMLTPAELKKDAYRELVEHLAAGRLVVDTEDFALERAEAAWTRQQKGGGPKIVIRP